MDTTLAIILSLFTFCGGGFIFLASKIDKLAKEIQDVRTELMREIQKNREDILWIKWRIDPNENHHWKSLEEEGKEIEK